MKLHEKVKAQEKLIKTYENSLNDLIAHLFSSKFQGEGNQWISTKDVHQKIQDIKNNVWELEIQEGLI